MASFSSSAAAADSGGDTDQNENGLTSPSSPSGLDEETTNLIVENLMQTGNFTRDVCLQAVGIAGTDESLCFDICTSLQSSVL